MTQQDKYYLETEKKLSSDNEHIILDTLAQIRKNGKASIIPLVIDLLDKKISEKVSKETIMLLGHLKDKEAVSFIVSGLKSAKTKEYRTELIMTCWQSGLDYSKYIESFVDAFIFGDFQTAIESFSVIEEWIHNSPEEQVTSSRKLLIDNLKDVTAEKKAFYLELIKLVESYL